jgi:VanZ family protein
VFAAYGSLLPFDLVPTSLEQAWAAFRRVLLSSPRRRISRSDLLANVLLFVPIGFAFAGAWLAGQRRRAPLIQAVVLILPVSLAASLLIEFLQVFTSNRTPSSTDIAAQTIGCLMGIGAWRIAGEALTTWLREAVAAAPEDRLERILTAYAAGWVLVSLAPFDITVDLGDLADRVRSGKIALVPFAGPGVFSARWLWDVTAELLSAIPLGLFGSIGASGGRYRRPALAFGLGLAIVVVIEGAQVFISSHSANATDVLFGGIGVLFGVVAAPRLAARDRATENSSTRAINWQAVSFLVFWILVLCAYHWRPYEFSLDAESIRYKLRRISFIPFDGYRSGSYLNALNNLLTKIALAMPLGVAAAFAIGRSLASRPMIAALWAVLAAGIFGAIEGGQLFVATRIPDPTDVLVGVAGALAGFRVGAWLQTSARATGHEASQKP